MIASAATMASPGTPPISAAGNPIKATSQIIRADGTILTPDF
jgi:hypothetical protein